MIVVVQHISSFVEDTSGDSFSLSFTNSVMQGSLLIYASFNANTSNHPTLASDNNSNAILNALNNTGQTSRIDYVKSANTGATQVSANSAGSGNFYHLHLWEISGCDPNAPLDQTHFATVNSPTGISTSNPIINPNELIFGFFVKPSVNLTFIPGSGFNPTEQTNDAT